MATDRQIEANRRNALTSTGPRTDAGKAASRGNALVHGLTGEGGVRNGAPQINNLPTTLQETNRLDGPTGIVAKYGTVRNFVEATITSGVRGTAMPRWSVRLGGPLREVVARHALRASRRSPSSRSPPAS